MAFQGFIKLTFKLALAVLIWSSVASPRPLHQRNAGECELTPHEVQNLVCLQKSIDDSTTEKIEELRLCSRAVSVALGGALDGLQVQQEYLLLLHYADQLEAVGHPDFSASMNQTVGLLMETLPQLNGTVERCTCGSGDGAEETSPLDLGSSIGESTLPFCYFELIKRLYSDVYLATSIYLPECSSCKRPENVESCSVSELTNDTLSFAQQMSTSLNLSKDCRASIRQCHVPRNLTDQEHVSLLMEVLQNETTLSTLADSDIVPRMSIALSSMNASLVNVCEECGECAVSNKTLSSILGPFYKEASQQNCHMSSLVEAEEVCLVNLLSTFEALYTSMVNAGYFQQCQ